MAGDIGNGIGYREDLVSLGVGDLNAKLLLQSHHHLDGVKGVQVKIILELGSGGDLGVGHLNQFEEGKSFGQSDKPFTNTRNGKYLLKVLDDLNNTLENDLVVQEGL